MNTARAIASFGGAGFLPKAPGTWGSLAALPVAWVLHGLGGFGLLLVATLAVTALGFWAIPKAVGDDHDPGWVVIDEVAGQWIALWPLSLGLSMADVGAWVFPWPGWVGAFVLFRLFDIWKPGPVGWADRQSGALGVMLDDLIAGAMAAVLVTLAAAISHGWLL
ncbi:phosphatidylglycerophosphatase A [Pontivivens ytuae]|uniref:Phosphatidylglycerophosphatase A n=1 Tax=Pontivivens ytuae TaxID=2789856 RepID=A0A7S9LRG5_9RHOB|nr:phosphatidylglycerophosphatase A [Pontivivens ytuae]QPH53893.1 phosphatidylglycerophosphatase A [Pontivivens ytuae]